MHGTDFINWKAKNATSMAPHLLFMLQVLYFNSALCFTKHKIYFSTSLHREICLQKHRVTCIITFLKGVLEPCLKMNAMQCFDNLLKKKNKKNLRQLPPESGLSEMNRKL